MRHQIENGSLTLEADTHGAELCSLRKAGGPGELLWSADPAVWGRHAPLCFPWCGRMRDNYFEEGGRRYEAGSHGFARDMEHMLSASGPDFLTFRLGWNGETLALWPWKFSLETTHRLEGDSVVTVCRVQNEDSRPMPFQLGFHTALRCPFTPGKAATDYLVRFEREESPLRVRCDENGARHRRGDPRLPRPVRRPAHTRALRRRQHLHEGPALLLGPARGSGNGPVSAHFLRGVPLYAALEQAGHSGLSLHRAVARPARAGGPGARVLRTPLPHHPRARRKLVVHPHSHRRRVTGRRPL